ncbi:MAG: magnesium transporter [Planctomycetes bacterium]|nr:magnesium transporter [Planctomycetota bacterium]
MPPVLPSAHFDDPVIKHLRQDFARLSVEQTVGEALITLRAKPPEGRIIYLYVTDADGKLQGVVPTRRLLLAPPEKPITEIMVRHAIAIPQNATVLEACEFFTLHRFLAFPVVDDQKRIVGVVDVELYTDELNELSGQEIFDKADDLFQIIGVHLAQAQHASAIKSFRLRFPWLLCNVAGGILAAFLSGLYEEELQKAVALALFIPVVLALAESVSIQSVTLGLVGLKDSRPSYRELVRKLLREMVTGLLLGIGCALLVGTTAALWKGDWRVTLCLVVGISGGIVSAAIIGLGVPYLLKLLKRDPQVAAGPISLAATDMITLLIYLNLARAVI